MRIKAFEWDEGNIGHIARHNITPEDVEEACCNDPLIFKGRNNRYYALGQSDNGHYLMIVFMIKFMGMARVITARPMQDAERKRYLRKGK